MLQKYITKLFLLLGIWITGQQYPVKLNPVLIPPYSVRLADYATSSEEKVRLQLLLTDLMQPSHQVNLRFSLEGASSSSPIAATNPSFSGMRPITIYPGTPLVLSNFDFRPLFELQNLVGINAAQYSRALPQGMYNFCFIAYDAINNQQLSQKSCAPIYLQNYDPPFLTLPANGEKVTRQNEFQNVIFQWMPRQEAPNTQYIFTLKEIWDTSINPTSAFLASRTLWQEKTNTRSIYYGMDKTALLEGKRYAWQVQAVSANQSLNGNIDPNNYNGVYQNNGLSEIFFFDYVRDCVAPIMLMAKNAGRGRVEIRWMMPNGQPQGLYNIQYRRRGSTGDWSEQKSYEETTFLTGLEDKTEYEYRVGSVCGDVQQYEPNPSGSASHQNAYTYSQIQYFTTNSDDKNPSYQCGVMPDVDISNKTPLTGVLSPNQSFTAGDFVVSVIKASGNGGNYSGEGFIVVPYLADTKVKVIFNNIQINSDKKLINGVVETTYDPKESAVSYVSTGVGELFGDQGIGYREVKYKVDHIEVVTTPPPGKIIIHSGPVNDGDSEGAGKEELPLGKDYEIKDEDGNIWYVDEKGNVTKGGKVAEGGASTSQNTDGVSGNGKNASLNAYTAKGVNMTWNASHSTYAYDDASKAVGKLQSEYPKVKDASGKDVYISYKAVVNKSSDTFEANVSFTDASLASQKVVFKTLENGKEIQANLTPGTETSASRTYTLQLEGTFSYATEQIIAVLMPKDKDTKQQVIGSFNLVHLEPKTVDVSLVPLDNASAKKLDTQAKNLNEIYKKVGVSFNVKKDSVLNVSSIVSGDAIETPDDKALSTYSQMQTSINNLYKGKDARYVLFVTNKKSSIGQNGYMRLNGQFGYIYGNAPTKTGAHELGHGAFKLEHPWSKYNSSQDATDLLMDYGTGTSLNHMDWKHINDPTLKLYAFQGQSEGEFNKGYAIAPDLSIFSVETNVTIFSDHVNNTPDGALEGFLLNEKYYAWTGTKYVAQYLDVNGNTKQDEYKLTPISKNKLSSTTYIYLFFERDKSQQKYIAVPVSKYTENTLEGFIQKWKNAPNSEITDKVVPENLQLLLPYRQGAPEKSGNGTMSSQGNGDENGTETRKEALEKANQLIVDKLKSKFPDKEIEVILLDENDPDFAQKLEEALQKTDKVIAYLDQEGQIQVNFSFSVPSWLTEALPDIAVRVDGDCANAYVNEGLEKLRKLQLYKLAPRSQQITMEVGVAMYNGLFGTLYCTMSEENNKNATSTGKFIAGALHEAISNFDIVMMVEGITTLVTKGGESVLNSPVVYYENLKNIANKGNATPKEILGVVLLPPTNTSIEFIEKGVQVGDAFIKSYFTECDKIKLKDGTIADMCAYRYGQITMMIAPLVVTGGTLAVTKLKDIGKFAKLMGKTESLAKNILTLESKLTKKAVILEEKAGKTLIKNAEGKVLKEVDGHNVSDIEKALDEISIGSHIDDLIKDYPNLRKWLDDPKLKKIFEKDFGNASPDVLKALDNRNAFDAWKNLREKNPTLILCN